jgi:large subunit ribosomal protein L1
MARISKRKKLMHTLVEEKKLYYMREAIEILTKNYAEKCKVKFNETIEIAIKTGINTQKNETVKGSVVLPNGTGKIVKIGVFAEGDDIAVAKSLGAEVITVEDVKAGKINFDTCVATPDVMPKLGPVAKILGPRGLMPNPKLGTVTKDLTKILKELAMGRVEFRSDKQGNVNLGIGKIDFTPTQIEENILALLNAVKLAKPVTTKGNYILSIALSSTMGVGVRMLLENLN